jgi:cardiolipin synthase
MTSADLGESGVVYSQGVSAFLELVQLRWVLELGFVVYVVAITGYVLLERRRPAATIAWLFALLLVPVLGLLAYILIGRRRVSRRRRSRARRALNPTDATRNVAKLHESPDELPQPMRGLVTLALRTAAAPLRRADSITVLDQAAEAFGSMEAAIDAAQHRIHLEFYIWRDDATGQNMIERLAARAREGVKVRLLYDDFGSFGTSSSHFRPLVDAGGEVAAYGSVRLRLRLSRSRLNFRNHRKILTVDGRVGFVGGLNIGDEYRGVSHDGREWNDMLVRLDGDAVVSLEAVFLEDWLSATRQLVELDADLPADQAIGVELKAEPTTPARSEGPLTQIIPSGPDVSLGPTLAAQFAGAIGTAQTRCWIATPYFVPDEPLMVLLRTAALRGVDVRILVPSAENNDNWLVAYAGRSYFDDLMSAGCHIFEYLPGMLHAKYLIVDDHVSAIGSANMDVRSLYINYEVTAMFYDPEVTAEVAAVYDADLSRAREVKRAERSNLPTHVRLLEGAARVLSPLL